MTDALPYGVFSTEDGRRRVGVLLGDAVVDLAALTRAERGPAAAELATGSLDALMAAGRPLWQELRAWLLDRLADPGAATLAPHLRRQDQVRMHLPFRVADYVDFYSSRAHAENVGRLFRPGSDPLPAAWLHLPLGYHGRAGTVVVSSTPIRRPCGLRPPSPGAAAELGPSLRLDVEAEVGFVVGTPTALGHPVPVDAFAEHVFGVVLVNDWSARDVQAFEYVPLGPFLGKSFATSVSAWVLPLDALDAARVPAPAREQPDQDYLREREPWGLDLSIEVALNGTVVSRPPYATTWWTGAQQLAHLTVNGASLRTGDLFASGTVSGPQPDQRGSLLELTWNGAEPVRLDDGTTRGYLQDGDSVLMTATAPAYGGGTLRLGEVEGTVLPARVLG